MDESGATFTTTFLGLSTRDGQVTEPMLALRLYGTSTDFGISLEVSFIERKKDERTLEKQAKVLKFQPLKVFII